MHARAAVAVFLTSVRTARNLSPHPDGEAGGVYGRRSCFFARTRVIEIVVGLAQAAHMPTQQDDDSNWGRFVGVGLQVALGVGLGVTVGLWLDRKLGWSPVGVIACSMLGLAGGMYLLIKDVMRMNKD